MVAGVQRRGRDQKLRVSAPFFYFFTFYTLCIGVRYYDSQKIWHPWVSVLLCLWYSILVETIFVTNS